MIRNNAHKYSVSAMCLVLKIPRSTYYYDAKRVVKEEPFTDPVIQVFRESRNNYGARRIKAALQKKGHRLSRKRIQRIMKENGLVSNYTVAQYKAHARKAPESTIPNRLNRQFNDHSPYAVIVSDLTYVRVGGKWHYVCLLADLFNREIVGYSAGPHKTAALVQQALSKVRGNLNQVQLFHTDQGSEFNNQLMAKALKTFGIQPSMSLKGCPYDNAVAEATFKTFKVEFIYQHQFEDLSHLRRELADYVNWFNRLRLHSSLDYNSPCEYRDLYQHNFPSRPVESL
ncbi:Transposase InsO and inactivated derivatives [Tindallia magadiensis]|uniref:Transposase InsO and inactivated derivatives n=1 Tax=Tindallia magadiensis TaxID=69895 RepID=A0A1I3I083_9FIRM|nr:Transposase InsO and inactivated derivatives [Tindallia magadiensis]